MEPIRLKNSLTTRKRLTAVAGAVLVSALALTGCGASGTTNASSSSTDTTYAPSLDVGTSISLASLNPFESQYSTINFSSYDPLVRLANGTGEAEPRLALSWETSADDLTWTFTLRDGVTFHDGTAFTAADVVGTLDTIKANKYTASSLLTNVASYAATDDATFTITTATPDPILLTKLSQIYIVPAAKWAEVGAEGFATAEYGTGEYTITDFVPNSGLTFTAYAEFWGTAPKTETINYTTFADQTALASALQAGQVDVAHQLNNTAIQTLGTNSDLELYAKFGGTQNMFQFNTTVAPFDNVELREAANLAIDADALITALTAGAGVKEDGQLPMEGIVGHTDTITRPDFDLDAAKEILEDNDAVGTPVTITGLSAYTTLYEAVAAMLTDAGFDVTVEAVDTSVWLSMFGAGTDASIFYRGLSYVGSTDADRPFSLVSTGAKPFVSDPEWDAVYAATKTEMDPAAREKLLIEASQFIADQSYILWTYGPPSVSATTTDVTGADFSTGIVLVLDNLQKAE